jgi:hypothetical protein
MPRARPCPIVLLLGALFIHEGRLTGDAAGSVCRRSRRSRSCSCARRLAGVPLALTRRVASAPRGARTQIALTAALVPGAGRDRRAADRGLRTRARAAARAAAGVTALALPTAAPATPYRSRPRPHAAGCHLTRARRRRRGGGGPSVPPGSSGRRATPRSRARGSRAIGRLAPRSRSGASRSAKRGRASRSRKASP